MLNGTKNGRDATKSRRQFGNMRLDGILLQFDGDIEHAAISNDLIF